MTQATQLGGRTRFGVFEADPRNGVLTRSGRRVDTAASAAMKSGRAASGTATAGARPMTARNAGSSASIVESWASGSVVT